MPARRPLALCLLTLTALLAACSDTTSPDQQLRATSAPVAFSGGIDSTQLSGGGGGGGGGGAGGGSVSSSCGTLANVQSYNIVVYTTRTGIGFGGTATNCGSRKEAFEVDAVDTETDPACVVNMPHFIAPRNTDPQATVTWQLNSTLVPCQGRTHTFVLTLWDTKTGQTMATTTTSTFL